jgi:hypothetical protein
MKHNLAESSHQDESNGNKIEFIGAIDIELLSEIPKTELTLLYYIDILKCNFLSSDQKRMKYSSLESSHQDELNGSKIELFGVIDGK